MANLKWAVLLLFLAIAPARAGICTSDPVASDSRHEFTFWAGYSPQSTRLIGTQTDRQFAVAGLTYAYRCWAWPSASLSFAASVLPLALVRQPRQLTTQIVPAHSVYGFATTPIGLSFDLGRQRRIYPFVAGDAGIVKSTEPIPLNLPGATSFNFMFDYGGGVKFRVGPRFVVTTGYKFLHISNAGSGDLNPGLDNNVFYAGFSVLR